MLPFIKRQLTKASPTRGGRGGGWVPKASANPLASGRKQWVRDRQIRCAERKLGIEFI